MKGVNGDERINILYISLPLYLNLLILLINENCQNDNGIPTKVPGCSINTEYKLLLGGGGVKRTDGYLQAFFRFSYIR